MQIAKDLNKKIQKIGRYLPQSNKFMTQTKKILILFIMVFAMVSSVSAIRPERRPYFFLQSDGTRVTVYRNGDGHSGVLFYTTEDDVVLVKGANGDLCYAYPEGDRLRSSGIMAHNASLRDAHETEYIKSVNLDLKKATSVVKSRRRGVRRVSAPGGDGLGTYGQKSSGAVPSIGNPVIPIVMVNFSDIKFSYTDAAHLERQYNEEGYTDDRGSVGSVRDYFIDQSNGMFKPEFKVVAEVELKKEASYYGKDESEDEIDVNLDEFVTEAFAAAVKKGFNPKNYVYNNDGVPCVVFIYAGQGEATSYGDDADGYLWPCEWDDYGTYGGAVINSFFIGNEMEYVWTRRGSSYVSSDPHYAGIGTFCHEFGHALGLPDFYCTNYGHDATPLGYWSIMDYGSYHNGGFAPVGYLAYEKSFMGWLNIRELTDPEAVTLAPSTASAGENAVLVRNDKNQKEYYIFENRQPGRWYPSNMAGGMLVTHFDYNASQWSANTLNNDEDHLRATVFAADGQVEPYSGQGLNFMSDLFTGSRVTEITNTSNPAMGAFTGTYMNKPLYKIAVKDDSLITFNFLEKEIYNYTVGDTITINGISYVLQKNKKAVVTASQSGKYEGDVIVPENFIHEDILFTVVGIDETAFCDCPSLYSVSFHTSVEKVADGAFSNSPNLMSIWVSTDNAKYESIDGALYTNRNLDGQAISSQATFDWANNPMGLPVSTNSSQAAGNINSAVTENDVTFTCTHGTTATRLWQSGTSITLRVYSTGTITLTAPAGASISKIEFTATDFSLTPDVGTMSSRTWTGEAESVTFTASSRTNITKIVVTLEATSSSMWTLLKAPQGKGGTFAAADGVKMIAAGALEGSKYTTIVLPASVEDLGASSVAAPMMTTLYAAMETAPTVSENPFTGVDQTACVLKVYDSSLNSYAATNWWKDFLQKEPISGELPTAIGSVSIFGGKNVIYDLQGRRVQQMQKGVYIINGKKVVK